jgi:hypothetical protein
MEVDGGGKSGKYVQGGRKKRAGQEGKEEYLV